jgi:selenocysteine lyase/cysteine desulfurase
MSLEIRNKVEKALLGFERELNVNKQTNFFFRENNAYHDWTASSLPIKPIERFIMKNVYPYYSNTHSNTFNGRLMKEYINKCREIIKLHCKIDDSPTQGRYAFKILFCGSGATSAIHLLVQFIKPNLQPTVFIISELEHNSNYLPWYELSKKSNVKLIVISTNSNGLINQQEYIDTLQTFQNTPTRVITSFIHASNITGIYQDIYSLSKISKQIITNSIFITDSATAFPYFKFDSKFFNFIDALVFSSHKMYGGVGGVGCLIVRKDILDSQDNTCPFPGGGSVRCVFKTKCVYSKDDETRNSAGTPNIIGIIKTLLAIIFKEQLYNSETKYQKKIKYFESKLKQLVSKYSTRLILLNPSLHPHPLPIYSIQITQPTGQSYFHSNFIVVLFNDLFNIQTRGGVSCAGMYAEKILHVNSNKRNQIMKNILQNHGYLNEYGWVRFSLSIFHSIEDIKYLLYAIEYICLNAHLYESFYKFIPSQNIYNHA